MLDDITYYIEYKTASKFSLTIGGIRMNGEMDNKETNYLNPETLDKYTEANTHQDQSANILPWVIQLRVVGTPSIIQVPTREMITIGRSDPRRDVSVDVDLSRFDGQKQGVSREHARLMSRDNRITVTDLKSANGTFINDRMLEPEEPYRLRDGDLLRFGKLEIQVSFVIQPYTSDETMVGIGNHFNIPESGTGQHILILDTDQIACDVLALIIRQAGFEVSKAYSIGEALSLIDSDSPPDVLILELLLQEGDGVDVVRYYRQKISPTNPVIAMTNVTAGYQTDQAMVAGVDIFMEKPIVIEELGQVLVNIAESISGS